MNIMMEEVKQLHEQFPTTSKREIKRLLVSQKSKGEVLKFLQSKAPSFNKQASALKAEQEELYNQVVAKSKALANFSEKSDQENAPSLPIMKKGRRLEVVPEKDGIQPEEKIESKINTKSTTESTQSGESSELDS